MAIKELQTRIALKYDSYSAWTTAPGKDLVLLKGELGICYIGDTNPESHVVPTVLFKVGDGTKTFEALPWASAKAADVYSWAKASEVKRDGKKLVFVGGGVDGSNVEVAFDYVTLDEVKAITDGLTTRIAALEGKFDGTNSVQSQIDALSGRIDDANTAITTGDAATLEAAKADATVKADAARDTAKEYAKEYVDDIATAQATKDAGQDSKISANEANIAQEIADRKTAVSDAITEVKGYAEAEADTAEAAAKAYAKEYTDTREAAIKTAYEKYADDKDAVRKTYIDSEVDKLEAADAALTTEDERLAGLISAETSARTEAVTAINAKLDVEKVSTAIATAKQEAIEAAAGDAADKVAALKVTVDANTAAIGVNAAAIAANAADIEANAGVISTLVGEDTDMSVREIAAEETAKIVAGADEKYDTLKEIADFIMGDETGAAKMANDIAKNAEDIDALEEDVADHETRLGAAEAAIAANTAAIESNDDDIAGLQTAVTKAQEDATKGINAAKAASDKVDTKAAEIKTAYEKYADDKDAALKTEVKDYADGIVDNEKSAREAAEAALQADIDTKLAADDFNAHVNGDHAGTATEITAEIATAVAGEKSAREIAVNAINAKIGTFDGTVEAAVTAVKTTADTNKTDLAALTTRVGTAESNITTLQGIVSTGADSNANLRNAITALQELTGDASKGNEKLRSDLDILAGKVNDGVTGLAATKAIADEAKSDAEDAQARVANIEADYLKQADLLIFQCGTSTTVDHKIEA